MTAELLPHLDWLRSTVGKHFSIYESDFRNRIMTRANVIEYALGIGDLNPMYLDENYSRGPEGSGHVVPPTWLATVVPPGSSI